MAVHSPGFLEDENLLRQLAQCGNGSLIEGVIGTHPGSTQDKLRALNIIRTTSALDYSVFLPLLLDGDWPLPQMSASVEVAPDSCHYRHLGDNARETCEKAIEDAWAFLGGKGKPRQHGLRLGIPEQAKLPVDGSSIYLSAFIASVAAMTGHTLVGNLLATGSFEEPIQRLGEKIELCNKVLENLCLDSDSMLVASSAPVAISAGMIRCDNKHEAIDKAFGFIPWLPEAEIERIHICCADKEASPWPAGVQSARMILPARVEPADLEGIVNELKSMIEGIERVAITLAVPMPVAARLGYELKNTGRSKISVMHAPDETLRPWWVNSTRQVPSACAGTEQKPEDVRRLVVGAVKGQVDPGWEPLTGPVCLDPKSLRRMTSELLAEISSCKRIDVAVKGPLVLGWAVGHTLRNTGKPFGFFHLCSSGGYEQWWSSET